MNEIKQWIISYLNNEVKVEINIDDPLFRQIDSFSIVGFLLALEDRFDFFHDVNVKNLGEMTVGEIAALLSTYKK